LVPVQLPRPPTSHRVRSEFVVSIADIPSSTQTLSGADVTWTAAEEAEDRADAARLRDKFLGRADATGG
jgi:hypothetical protein